MKKLATLILVTGAWPVQLLAQSQTPQVIIEQKIQVLMPASSEAVPTKTQIIQNLRTHRLERTQEKETRFVLSEDQMSRDLWAPAIPETREGLEGKPPLPSSNESPYSAAELIEKALKDRLRYTIGQRLEFLSRQAQRIVASSGKRPSEQALRMSLNRCLDIMSHTLPLAGRNSEGVAQWASNFYVRCFELAASYGHQKAAFEVQPSTETESYSDTILRMSSAKFGYQYARLVWNSADSLTSASSKAVMLSKLLAYLAWDLAADHQRRERGIAQLLSDIFEAQHSPAFEQILASMEKDLEPRSADLARFRSDVDDILSALPGRLIQSGIAVSP